MNILLMAVILAVALPFFSNWFYPIVLSTMILSLYLLTIKKIQLIKLILSLSVIIFVCFSSIGLKSDVDSISHYLEKTQVELVLEVVDYNGDYATMKIISYRGESIRGSHHILYFSEDELIIGNVLTYKGSVKKYNQYLNPATFSPTNIYLYKNYGYITDSMGKLEEIWVGESGGNNQDSNQFINNRLSKLSQDAEALAQGVLLGNRGKLSTSQVQNFKESGLIHITAVSGLHIGIIFMVFKSLSKTLVSKKTSTITGYIFAFIFAWVVGFRPSTLRAIMMLGIYSLAEVKGYPYSLARALQVTALLNIIYNPFIIFDLGFQFSYLAVFGIVYIAPKINFLEKISNGYIKSILTTTIAIQIALLPLNFLYNRGIPLLTPVGNLLIAPILPPYLTLLLAYVFFPVILIKVPIELISYYILGVSRITSYWLTLERGLILCIIILAVIYPLVKKLKSKRSKITIVIIVTIVITVSIFYQPQVTIYFLDVGQGDSAIIQYRGCNILVDTGGIVGTNIGERVLIPTFNYLGIQKLDYVFLTHPHYDHIGALVDIIDHIKIDRIIIPDNALMYSSTFLEVLEIIEDRSIEIISIKKGDHLQIGDLNKFVLHPTSDFNPVQSPANNISLVTLVEYRGNTVLFTGDIEAEAEQYILDMDVLAPIDILKVAHHGSNSSTPDEFLDIVAPKSAIISVGNNKYGHPSADVLERLEERDIDTYTTQSDGMITVKMYRTGRYKIKSFVR